MLFFPRAIPDRVIIWLNMAGTGAMFLITALSFLWLFQLGMVVFLPAGMGFSGEVAKELVAMLLFGSPIYFAAMITAWSRWACRAGLSAFLTCLVLVVIWLAFTQATGKLGSEISIGMLLTPLAAAPLGGWMGGRIRAQK